MDELWGTAVDDHDAVGSREGDHVGAAARHERQSVVQRNQSGLLGNASLLGGAAAGQKRAAEQSADDPRQELSTIDHHNPAMVPVLSPNELCGAPIFSRMV